MNISPINIYNYGNRPSFGSLERAPKNVDLKLNAPVQNSIPRTFSYSSLMTVTENADRMPENAMSTIAYRALKDIRKFQDESEIYSREAKKIKRNFDKNYAEEIRYHERVKLQHGDDAPSEIVKNDGSVYICYYRPNGDTYKINKARNGKLEKTYYTDMMDATGKINCFEYREDGTLKQVSIGIKRNIDGSTKTDKVYVYNEKGTLFSAAMNVLTRRDGSMEMTNYCKPNRRDPEFIDRYVAKRTVNPDGFVTYEGAIYFSRKEFDSFYHFRSFAPGEEHKIRYNI